MKTNKFRSWNEIDGCFYYFENGKYFDENNKEIDERCFDWSNAEQFAGLLDKNVKDIYKGDIVKFKPMKKYKKDYELSEVVFKDNCWCLDDNKTYLKSNFSLTGVEIIGNTHENPELIVMKS